MAQLGRYQIERLLAKGGMAEVFLGRAEGPAGFAKNVVIKRIRPQYALEPAFVQMFLDEARLAALLNHPNIAQVFDFGQDQGDYFIAMEYIEGESLRVLHGHFLSEKRLIPQRFVLQILIGACEGLHYAHQLGDAHGASHNIVHRDISPDNILVSLTGTAKIVDFGIAKAASSTQDKTGIGTLKGKRSYVSPEQILGERLDRRIDVYAMGVTLFELLTGRRPFIAEGDGELLQSILKDPTPEAAKLNPEVPEPLSKIVAKAMARNREERYQDARSLQTALEEVQAASGKKMTSAGLTQLVAGVSTSRKARLGSKAVPGSPLPADRGAVVLGRSPALVEQLNPADIPGVAPSRSFAAESVPGGAAGEESSSPMPTDPGPPFFGPTPAPTGLPPDDTTERLTVPAKLEADAEPEKVSPSEEPTLIDAHVPTPPPAPPKAAAPPSEPAPRTVSERHPGREPSTKVPGERAVPAVRRGWRGVAVAFGIGGGLAAAALAIWLVRQRRPATPATPATPTAETKRK